MMGLTVADCIVLFGVFVVIGLLVAAMFAPPTVGPMVIHKNLVMGVDNFIITFQSDDGTRIELSGPDVEFLEQDDILYIDQPGTEKTTVWKVMYRTRHKRVRCMRAGS